MTRSIMAAASVLAVTAALLTQEARAQASPAVGPSPKATCGQSLHYSTGRGASGPLGSPAPRQPPVQHALALRRQLGLRASTGYAARLSRGGSASSNNGYGIPMTQAELAELLRRDKAAGDIPRLDATQMQINPSTYAGAWIDQPSGGVINVNFVSTSRPPDANSIASLFPRNTPIVIHNTASIDKEALHKLYLRISDGFQYWNARGVVIKGAAESIPDNVVTVTVSSPINVARSVLYAHYGCRGLNVVPGKGGTDQVARPQRPGTAPAAADPRDIRGGPLYGGEKITITGGCTAGYSDAPGSFNPGNLWSVTAGHCVLTPQENVYQGGFASNTFLGQAGTNNGLTGAVG